MLQYHEALPSSANDEVRCDCTFADDGNASWYWVCRVPMVEWRLDCENCRHLTVVGLHDTGPWTRLYLFVCLFAFCCCCCCFFFVFLFLFFCGVFFWWFLGLFWVVVVFFFGWNRQLIKPGRKLECSDGREWGGVGAGGGGGGGGWGGRVRAKESYRKRRFLPSLIG